MIAVDVRTPEGLRVAMAELSAGSVSWSSPTGVAVLRLIEATAVRCWHRTPQQVRDPHIVESTVSHVWERLTIVGQAKSVVSANNPSWMLWRIVSRTMVQVARASAYCTADPSATHRATPKGDSLARMGDWDPTGRARDQVALAARTVVDEMTEDVRSAVSTACVRAGRTVADADETGVRAGDALRYIVDEVAARGVSAAHRRLSQDPALAGLLPWWSARALVWAVTGSASGQGSWESAKSSVFARLHVARAAGDERLIADIAPSWATVLGRVTASFRADLPIPAPSGQVVALEQPLLPGLAVAL